MYWSLNVDNRYVLIAIWFLIIVGFTAGGFYIIANSLPTEKTIDDFQSDCINSGGVFTKGYTTNNSFCTYTGLLGHQ